MVGDPDNALFGEKGTQGSRLNSDNDDQGEEKLSSIRPHSSSGSSTSLMQQSSQDGTTEDAISSHTASPPRSPVPTRQQLARAAKTSVIVASQLRQVQVVDIVFGSTCREEASSSAVSLAHVLAQEIADGYCGCCLAKAAQSKSTWFVQVDSRMLSLCSFLWLHTLHILHTIFHIIRLFAIFPSICCFSHLNCTSPSTQRNSARFSINSPRSEQIFCQC